MISDFGKEEKHVEEQAYRSADDRLAQLEVGCKAEGVAREVGVSKHTIYAQKVKYSGMDVSEAQEAKRLREENARLRKLVESGQRSLAVRDPKERLGLVARMAAIGRMREEYAFGEQRTCRLLDVAVLSHRYQPRRSNRRNETGGADAGEAALRLPALTRAVAVARLTSAAVDGPPSPELWESGNPAASAGFS